MTRIGRGRGDGGRGHSNRGRGYNNNGRSGRVVGQHDTEGSLSSAIPQQQSMPPPTTEQQSMPPTTTEQGIVRSVARRGPSRGIPPSPDPALRPIATISGLYFTGKAPRTKACCIMRGYFNRPYNSWGEWPSDLRESCWRKFLEFFRFETPEIEEQGRRVFHHHCNENWRKTLCTARRNAEKKSGSAQPLTFIPHCPRWMAHDIWARLCNHWASVEWGNKSTAGKRSRAANSFPIHIGGSMPFVEHHEKLKFEKERDPTIPEKWLKTHLRKDKTWINPQSKKIHDD